MATSAPMSSRCWAGFVALEAARGEDALRRMDEYESIWSSAIYPKPKPHLREVGN
jgi:hypothetical protein